MAFDPRAFFVRFLSAVNERDFDSMRQMIHPDFVADLPQSGERSRGYAQFIAQLAEYPGATDVVALVNDAKVIGDEERWAITPAYTVVPLASPNEFVAVTRSQYPDGSWWHLLAVVEVRDEKLYRLENYFAPELGAPLAESIAAYDHG